MGTPGSIDDIRPFAELAQNATTSVYKAYQASLERFVLLKRLRPSVSRDEELAARFQEEARIAARIQHPNVVSIYAYGSDDEGAYIVAEYVEGFDLAELIARSKIPADVALYILSQSARGLKAAHDKNVLHRDLKPSNILISRDGGVKLSDFGLASVSGVGDGCPSEIRGTLAYLAPEQILESEIDERSDLFALGATFFEMLTGRRAFPGSSTQEIFDAILNGSPLPFLSATAGVDGRVDDICSRLLARDPSDRFPDAEAVITAVEQCRHVRHAHVNGVVLSAYVDDPSTFAVPKAALRETPHVTVVDEPDDDGEKGRWTTRPWRAAAAAAVALCFTAALVYAGVSLFLSASSLSPYDVAALRGVSDSATADSAAFARGADSTDVTAGFTDSLTLTGSEAGTTRDGSSGREPLANAVASRSRMERAVSVPSTLGYVSVSVDTAAAVFFDEDSAGVAKAGSPLLVRLPAGEHDVTIRNPAFPLEIRTVSVRSGDTTFVDVPLWSTVGRLELRVSPWANVYVDGRFAGQTPIRPWLILKPGVYELRLVHPEHGEYETTITIPSGRIVSRDFILAEPN